MDCSSIKGVRELGLDRRESGWPLSTMGVGRLRIDRLRTKGAGGGGRWCNRMVPQRRSFVVQLRRWNASREFFVCGVSFWQPWTIAGPLGVDGVQTPKGPSRAPSPRLFPFPGENFFFGKKIPLGFEIALQGRNRLIRRCLKPLQEPVCSLAQLNFRKKPFSGPGSQPRKVSAESVFAAVWAVR